MPTVAASTSTPPRIWRLLAPSARSRPFSRVRCATVIENVLKIMKAPTSRATTAKISMKVLKTACPAGTCPASPCDRRPGHRLRAVRQHALQVGDQLLLRHARGGDEPDAVNFPGPATSRCATGMVNSTTARRPGCRPCRT